MGKRLRKAILLGCLSYAIMGLIGCSAAEKTDTSDGAAAVPTAQVAKEGEDPEEFYLEIEHQPGERLAGAAATSAPEADSSKDGTGTEDEDKSKDSGGDSGVKKSDTYDKSKDSGTDDKKPDADSEEYTTVMVIASSVNLREKPDLGSEVIVNVKYGTLLQRIEEGEEWDKLWYEEQEVYAFAEYLQLPEEVEAAQE